MSDYSYLGSGKIYMREAGASAPLVEIGNASKLDFGVTEETKELKDFTQAGGGTYNEVRRVSAVEMSLTVHDLSPENLARAVYGTSTVVTAGTATDEALTARKGGINPLAKIPTAITNVKKGATTYVAGTDYELRAGGLYIPSTSTIVDADAITCSYTYGGQDVVQALVTSGKEYEVLFAGLNEARSGKETRVHAYRVKLGATSALALLGENYAGLEIKGKLLKDTTKNGTTVSQYFKADMVQ
jgi:hypothetical protein